MRLTPIQHTYDTVDAFQTDLLGRKPFAEGLTNLICHAEEPLVLSIEAPWGEGKTTFVHQWRRYMEQRDPALRCIYFDAFKSDIHNDAFLSLLHELQLYAAEHLKQENQALETVKTKAKKLFKILGGASYRTVLKLLPLGELADGAVQDVAEDIRDQLSDNADSVIDEIFKNREQSEELIQSFQSTLAELVAHLYGEGEQPLVFIIDELDRCRPDFALEILEKVKHIFSIPRICFVLVNNPEQLQESVRAAYGQGIKADLYLQKFYSLSLTLPKKSKAIRRANHDTRVYVTHVLEDLELRRCMHADSVAFLIELLERSKASLRQIEKTIANLCVYINTLGDPYIEDSAGGCAVTFLCYLKTASPEIFKSMCDDNYSTSEIKNALVWEWEPNDHSDYSEGCKYILCLWLDDNYEFSCEDEAREVKEYNQYIGRGVKDRIWLQSHWCQPFLFIS